VSLEDAINHDAQNGVLWTLNILLLGGISALPNKVMTFLLHTYNT